MPHVERQPVNAMLVSNPNVAPDAIPISIAQTVGQSASMQPVRRTQAITLTQSGAVKHW
jgi:hypothetical protein